MADACSGVFGSPAFSGSRWGVAVVRMLSSAKLMRGDRSGYGAYPGYTRASSNASGRVTRRKRKGPSAPPWRTPLSIASPGGKACGPDDRVEPGLDVLGDEG